MSHLVPFYPIRKGQDTGGMLLAKSRIILTTSYIIRSTTSELGFVECSLATTKGYFDNQSIPSHHKFSRKSTLIDFIFNFFAEIEIDYNDFYNQISKADLTITWAQRYPEHFQTLFEYYATKMPYSLLILIFCRFQLIPFHFEGYLPRYVQTNSQIDISKFLLTREILDCLYGFFAFYQFPLQYSPTNACHYMTKCLESIVGRQVNLSQFPIEKRIADLKTKGIAFTLPESFEILWIINQNKIQLLVPSYYSFDISPTISMPAIQEQQFMCDENKLSLLLQTYPTHFSQLSQRFQDFPRIFARSLKDYHKIHECLKEIHPLYLLVVAIELNSPNIEDIFSTIELKEYHIPNISIFVYNLVQQIEEKNDLLRSYANQFWDLFDLIHKMTFPVCKKYGIGQMSQLFTNICHFFDLYDLIFPEKEKPKVHQEKEPEIVLPHFPKIPMKEIHQEISNLQIPFSFPNDAEIYSDSDSESRSEEEEEVEKEKEVKLSFADQIIAKLIDDTNKPDIFWGDNNDDVNYHQPTINLPQKH